MQTTFKITCVGAGYVGGPTMAVIAEKCPGVKVYVYDKNVELIEKWKSSTIPIFEIGISEVVQKTLGKSLFFTSDIREATQDTNMIFIAVNTPTKTNGKGAGKACATKYFENAVREIAEFVSQYQLKDDLLIIEKSTVPVGTCEWIEKLFVDSQRRYPENQEKIIVLSNPEFMAEGTALNDLLYPDRIIIGGTKSAKSQKGIEILKHLYLNWVPEENILTPNIFSSELGKIISNAFLAQRISSINSISAMCEKTGADIDEISMLVGSDSRIGNKFLKTSVGFGGSCLQKDVLHLIYLCESLGLNEVASYWQGVIQINEFQKKRFSDLIITKMYNNLCNKRLCIFGVAFKKNTHDVRGTAALQIIFNLLKEEAILNIYDPKASREDFILQMRYMNLWEEEFEERLIWFEEPYETSELTHAIIILTDWDEFQKYDYQKIYNNMNKPAFLFDGRNSLKSAKVEEIGFDSYFIGK